MKCPLPGRRRIAIGITLFFIGAGLSFVNLYVGDAIFYGGLGLIVWGAYAYFQEKRALRQLDSREAYRDRLPLLQGPAYPPPPPPPPAPPSPGYAPTPIQGVDNLSRNLAGPFSYVVEYSAREGRKSAVFATFNPANEFYAVLVGTRSLIKVDRDGQRLVLLPNATPQAGTTPPYQSKQAPKVRVPQFDRVAAFLSHYRPSQRFSREFEFQVELRQAMRSHFGNESVRWEVPVGEGRIDLDVFGVGIELKIAGSTSSLLGLLEQASRYRQQYGPNLMLVILDDTGGSEKVEDLNRFLTGQGIQVYVK